MKSLTKLGRALRTIRFYKWSFGDLTASDSDIGMAAEYLVGEILDCLPPGRKVNALFDLVTKSGVSIEVKATTKPHEERGRKPVYCWRISTQAAAIKGERPIADVWVLLIAKFPSSSVDILDYRYWRAYVVTADQLRACKVTKTLRESALTRLGLASFSLAELKRNFSAVMDRTGKFKQT